MIENPVGSLFVFPITIPNNPLKWLNCYVVKPSDGGRCLLIDTGFNLPECKADLLDGISKLNLSPDNTDIFLTHMHTDHTGNASMLHEMGFNLLMGNIDLDRTNSIDKSFFIEASSYMGFPPDEFGKMIRSQLASKNTDFSIDADPVYDGQILKYGEFEFTAILTPGHTPGHMCLYDRSHKIFISGDSILFDISPNITSFIDIKDSLGDYLSSLEKIRNLDVDYVFPGHRSYGLLPFKARIDSLITHHNRRLDETLKIVSSSNHGLSAVDVASQMHWNLRAASWDEIAGGQKWFAAGEAMAHLEHLCSINKLCSEKIDGTILYRCV